MKLSHYLIGASLVLAGTTQAATVLGAGETWSGYDVHDFESDAGGKGLTEQVNSGSNGGIWSNNSQGGKFVTNSGFAVTDGDAGTWTRSISYGTAIDSGKWRLVLDVGAYDLSTFNNMTGVNELTLELRDGTNSVAKVSFRIHDDAGSDGIADQSQVAMSIDSDGAFNSSFSGKDSGMTVANNAVWDYVAIEFDFGTGEVFLERNGVTTRGTGEAQDTGDITFTQFTELRLLTTGDWASSTADTGVINTDLIGLYTVAVPEPSSTALLGLGGLALILRRRK